MDELRSQVSVSPTISNSTNHLDRVPWSHDEKIILIEMAERFEVLWNTRYPYFRELTQRKHALEHIYVQLGGRHTVKDINAQWRNLKDVFHKKKALMDRRNEQDNITSEPVWRYYKPLKFLLNFEDERKRNCRIQDSYEIAKLRQLRFSKRNADITNYIKDKTIVLDDFDTDVLPQFSDRDNLEVEDHLTKYVLLRPLRTKTANEVVSNLIQIFADFGAPKILHSDNGREFANKLVIELVSAWPQCKIVHGKPRHSQSQGSVERANRDIGDMLTIYLRENRTKNWAVALPKIQVMKNARFHGGIKRSPYEALFGSKVGEQLQPDYSELECDEESDESNSSFKILDGTHWLDVDRNIGLEMDEQIASNPAEQLSSVIAEEEVLNLQHFQREIEREGARVSQQLQATQMIEKSNKRLADVDVGDSVRVSVPDVDRSKVDHRNILGIVLEVEEGFYKIGTKNGILKQSFSRNQFERCNVKFLDKSDIPNTEVALRSAVGLSSSSGSTQGLLQCNCVKCITNKCSCKKAGRLCNSRCHSSRDCHNK